MSKLRKFEFIFCISVTLFLGSYFSYSAITSDKFISGIWKAVVAITLFIYAILCLDTLIFKEVQHRYFDEEKD